MQKVVFSILIGFLALSLLVSCGDGDHPTDSAEGGLGGT